MPLALFLFLKIFKIVLLIVHISSEARAFGARGRQI